MDKGSLGHPARLCGLPCRVAPLPQGGHRVRLAFGASTKLRPGGLDAIRSHGEYERLTPRQYAAWLARLGERDEPLGAPLPGKAPTTRKMIRP